jgi:hypothetical protein
MESIGILRVLWRRRLLVALGAMLALALALLSLYRISPGLPPSLQSQTTRSGFAWQRLLVDTPHSVLADAKALGADAIASKAVLLGDLTEGDSVRRQMAADIGVRPADVGVIGPGSLVPAMVTPLATQALEVTRPHQPYLVSISESPDLPILSVFATAPEPADAARLVRATAAAIGSLSRRALGPGGEARVEPLGAVQTGARVGGPRKAKALAVAAILLLLWCVGVVLFDALARRRRLA